jgi:NADPH:quinone reductase-like Zn-dependent oxidoreductase
MKAIVYERYGGPDVLHLEDVPDLAPEAGEILIRVRATRVGFGDVYARDFARISPRAFSMPLAFWLPARLAIGLRRPRRRVLGSELSGEVHVVGEAAARFRPGEAVFAYLGQSFGAYAEYVCMRERGMVARMPGNMTFEEAATVPYGAVTALNLLRRVGVQSGRSVLVLGASGGIGSYALQIAKHQGARVTGVCSTPGVEMVRALGADHVIDYTREDFTRNGERYDLIFDVVRKTTFARVRGSLTPTGVYLMASFKTKHLMQMLWTSLRSGQRVICGLSVEKPADLETVRELVEAGALRTVIDRRFPLARAAESHRYAEQPGRRGHVVLTVGAPESGAAAPELAAAQGTPLSEGQP